MGSPTRDFCTRSKSSNRSESMDHRLATSTLKQDSTLGFTSISVNPRLEFPTTAAETNLSIDSSNHLMGFVPRGPSSDRSDSTGSHTPPALTCTHRLLQPDIPKELVTSPKKISKRLATSTLQQDSPLGFRSTSVNPCSEILSSAAETNLSIDTSSHLMGFVSRGPSSDRSDSTGSHTPPALTCTHRLLQPDIPKELVTCPMKISKRQLFRSPDCVATPTRSPHLNSNIGRSSADVQVKNDSGHDNTRILSVLHDEVMYGGNVIIPEQHKDGNLNCNYSKIENDSCSKFEQNVLSTPPRQIIRNVDNVCMGAPRKLGRRSYSKVKGFSSVCRKLEF